MFQSSFSGPQRCINEPNVKVATKNAKVTVKEMVRPNLKKNWKLQDSKNIPLPRVVIYPLKILTPIYL
jgi:hypothetical protein